MTGKKHHSARSDLYFGEIDITLHSGRVISVTYDDVPTAITIMKGFGDMLRKSPADRNKCWIACRTVMGVDEDTGDVVSNELPIAIVDYRQVAAVEFGVMLKEEDSGETE